MSTSPWSHSRIRLYLDCPHAYYLHYVQGEPGVPSEAMVRGKHLHEAIARYARHCYRKGKRSLKTDFDEGRKIAAGYPELEGTIRDFIQNMAWEWGSVLPGENGPVESMYSATLPNDETFRGRIDLLQKQEGARSDDPFAEGDDEWWVTDWKSGFGMFAEDEPPLQLLAYAWLVQANFPEAKNLRLAIESIAAPWSPKPWNVSGDLSYVADKLCSIIDRVRADDECEPTVGVACQNCNYIAACKHAKSAMVAAVAGQNVVGLAEQVALLDPVTGAAKKLLKRAVEEHGPAVVGAAAWGFYESESTRPASVRQAIELCLAEGFEPWAYIGMTAAQFEKLLKNAPEKLRGELEALAETKTSRQFALRDLAVVAASTPVTRQEAPAKAPRTEAELATEAAAQVRRRKAVAGDTEAPRVQTAHIASDLVEAF